MRVGIIDVEVWKGIKGYEGIYKVSNLGNVKSLKRLTNIHGKETWIYSEKLLKPSKDKKGYLIVNLYKNKKCKSMKVHRLVALAFLKNPEFKRCVCHYDNNTSNNKIDNLYWGTDKENQKQAWDDGLHKNLISVYSVDENGKRVKYKSQSEASKKTKIPQSNIWKCCEGLRHTAGGYTWEKG